jgi:hypothetical protein
VDAKQAECTWVQGNTKRRESNASEGKAKAKRRQSEGKAKETLFGCHWTRGKADGGKKGKWMQTKSDGCMI